MENLSIKELLDLQSNSLAELRKRGILRSGNKPTGDLAEHLCCKAFGWKITTNSQCGFDAVDESGIRYQIKARQVVKGSSGERQMSAIRGLEKRQFDYLVGVLFQKDYSILKAALVPYSVINDGRLYYSAHDNKHTFFLKDNVWEVSGVKDITENLKSALLLL